MTVTISPPMFLQFFDPNNSGAPLAGGKLFTYIAGTSTKQATWTDSTQTVQNANPIILDSNGVAIVWIDPSLLYKYVLAPANDTDPPASPLRTVDNIQGFAFFPVLPAESGLTIKLQYPYGDVRRYGLIPNLSGATATANATFLNAALNPSVAGITGRIYFPNTTGSDIWYLGNMIFIRDGVRLDLGGCTINCTKVYAAADNLTGWFTFIRDVTIENGSIIVNYDGTAGAGQNPGPVMRIGSRQGYAFATFTGGIFDQDDLVAHGIAPMGNITLRNLRMQTNNPLVACSVMVLMLGGLQGLLAENIVLTGNGNTGPESGFYYEFGYATVNGFPTVSQRWSSSHAQDLVFRNIKGLNLNTTAGSDPYVVAIVEAWSVWAENIHAESCVGSFEFRIGEAHFFRPWTLNATGAKRAVHAKNCTTQGALTTSIFLAGAQPTTAGYLSDANMIAAGLPVLTPNQKVDLAHCFLDGFAVDGPTGVKASAIVEIKNGTAIGGTNPIFLDGDCSAFTLVNVEALNGSGNGMRINDASTLFPRVRRGTITNCKVCGNGTGGVNQVGIALDNVENVEVKSCQLGYNTAFDPANEATQLQGVSIGANGTNVTIDNNHTTVAAGAAYNKTTGSSTTGCRFVGGSGLKTLTGIFNYGGPAVLSNIVFSGSITVDCTVGNIFAINANAGGAYTINAPLNPMIMEIIIEVQNTSGGVLGAATFNAVFKVGAAWVNPANGFARQIRFEWNGTNWRESGRSAADIPL